MAERLLIHNFAGLSNLEIEFENITILIGPQSTGKSICAKSIYYFRTFIPDLFSSIEKEQNKREFDTNFLQKFENYFPQQSWSKGDFFLRYELNDTFIQVERKKSRLRLTYSEYYKKEMIFWRSKIRRYISEQINPKQQDYFTLNNKLRGQYTSQQVSNLDRNVAFNQVFIPAGRSFFAVLQNSIFTFLSSNKAIDPFLALFGSFYETVKLFGTIEPKNDKDKAYKNKVNSMIEDILSAKYVYEGGQDYLVFQDGRRTSLPNSSSGQQEMLPLAIILSNILSIRFLSETGYIIYIEEPEAHLFPSAQRKIVQLIATIYNNPKIPVQFVITTHSPYILASFNNLIYAGNTSIDIGDEKLNDLQKVVPEDQMLKYTDIRTYSLHNRTAESIMSPDSGLISTNILDEVSDELAIQFDRLLNVED